MPSSPRVLKPASEPTYEPNSVASWKSRSLAVVVITFPSESLRTTSRSITRTMRFSLSFSSSGRISPLNWLPGKATIRSCSGPGRSIPSSYAGLVDHQDQDPEQCGAGDDVEGHRVAGMEHLAELCGASGAHDLPSLLEKQILAPD